MSLIETYKGKVRTNGSNRRVSIPAIIWEELGLKNAETIKVTIEKVE